MLHQFADIHTHRPGLPSSILSVSAEEAERIVRSNASLPAEHQQYYSLQLHPWHLSDESDVERYVDMAQSLQSDPHFAAIGECGLDSLCPTPLDFQHTAFLAALRLAQELQKPIIIHCVRLWAEMMADVKASQLSLPATALIIHGFRKGPRLAQQLLDAGFSISLGLNYHSEVAGLIPPERLYHETDEGPFC